MGASPVLVSSIQSGKEPVSSGNAVLLEDMTSLTRRLVLPVAAIVSSISVPDTLAAGVRCRPGAKRISATSRALSSSRNVSVPLRGLTRLSARRFLLGGLEFLIRLERMNDFLSRFDKITLDIIA